MINLKIDAYQEIKAKLQEIVDDYAFYKLMDDVIYNIGETEKIIECAEIIKNRERGGAFYHLKSWAIANKQNNIKELYNISRQFGIMPATIRANIEKGNLILGAENTGANVDVLRSLPRKFFSMARKRNGKALSYILSAVDFIESKIKSNDNDKITITNINKEWCAKEGSLAKNLDIIKPSDWWTFGHPKWMQEKGEEGFRGSIPGEIYANALFYFGHLEGVAVDAMAGSGMFKRVYDDRLLWQKDLNFNLSIKLYDLYPKKDFIQKHDATKPLPLKADWIFLDPPYFKQCDHLYQGFMANTDKYNEYLEYLDKVVVAMQQSLNFKGRLCIFLPKYIETDIKKEIVVYDTPNDICNLAKKNGLKWINNAYVSRARQHESGSAFKNISAKKEKRMISDVCVLNVFEKGK
jgi:hypothetical protein